MGPFGCGQLNPRGAGGSPQCYMMNTRERGGGGRDRERRLHSLVKDDAGAAPSSVNGRESFSPVPHRKLQVKSEGARHIKDSSGARSLHVHRGRLVVSGHSGSPHPTKTLESVFTALERSEQLF